MFFIISGFLITWLLLQEDARANKISLRRFYIRRALRILPVYSAFLVVLAIFQWRTPYHQPWATWINNLTFTINYALEGNFTSGHLWSLAIEEQFYLLWPGLIVALGLARNFRNACRVLALPIFLAPFCRVASALGMWPHILPVYNFFNFFDSLAMGCLAAYMYRHQADWIRQQFFQRPRLLAGASLALIIIPRVFGHAKLLGYVVVPFGSTLQALGLATLLLQSILRPSPNIYRLLDNSILRQIGVLSYSIYIWQEIFCTHLEVFSWQLAWWNSFPGWLAAAAMVSIASYYGLEKPLLQQRARFRV